MIDTPNGQPLDLLKLRNRLQVGQSAMASVARALGLDPKIKADLDRMFSDTYCLADQVDRLTSLRRDAVGTLDAAHEVLSRHIDRPNGMTIEEFMTEQTNKIRAVVSRMSAELLRQRKADQPRRTLTRTHDNGQP